MTRRYGAHSAGWTILLLASATVLVLGCRDGGGADDPVAPADTTPPAAVADLRIVSISGNVVTLTWTAPGDDGTTGTASGYDLRYADAALTSANWATASPASAPSPASAGTTETTSVTVATSGTVHFALRTGDEADNWSPISNGVSAAVNATFVVHQLTASGRNLQPWVDNGIVVWVDATYVVDNDIWIANLAGASPTPARLTDNGGEKARPNNAGQARVVWEGRLSASDDWEIWVYDEVAVPRYRAFTDNAVPDRFVDLAGNGDFAWLSGYTMYEEVHYWNEDLHTESVISDGCCPSAEWANDIPSADDGAVIWRAYHRSVGSGYRTNYWDGALTDFSSVVEASMTIYYSLDAGALAYEYGSGPPLIRYWDRAMVHDVANGYDPSLDAGTVAFRVYDGHDWEIRWWDGTTVHPITDNDFNDMDPCLEGGYLVWSGRPGGGMDQIFWTSVAK